MSSLCKSSWIKQLLPQPLREKETQSSLARLHMPAYFSTRGHNSKLSTIFPPGPPWCWQSTNWWSLCWSGPSRRRAKELQLCQEGWSRRRSPGHLCPLDCVLTTAPDPERRPNKPSRETADRDPCHFSLTEGKQSNGVRQARRLCAA